MSTAAMDRGILMAAMGPQAASSLPAAMTGGESSTDAEVMLRVALGEDGGELSWKPGRVRFGAAGTVWAL